MEARVRGRDGLGQPFAYEGALTPRRARGPPPELRRDDREHRRLAGPLHRHARRNRPAREHDHRLLKRPRRDARRPRALGEVAALPGFRWRPPPGSRPRHPRGVRMQPADDRARPRGHLPRLRGPPHPGRHGQPIPAAAPGRADRQPPRSRPSPASATGGSPTTAATSWSPTSRAEDVLWDLEADPMETENLAATQPEEVRRLREYLPCLSPEPAIIPPPLPAAVFPASIMSLRSTLAAILLAAVAIPATAQSEATTGIIRGTVRGPDGATVGGAQVLIQHAETGFVTSVETTATGTFARTLLPLGSYELIVTKGRRRTDGAARRPDASRRREPEPRHRTQGGRRRGDHGVDGRLRHAPRPKT